MAQFLHTQSITEELFGDNPSLLIELFSISDIEGSAEVIRFTGGVNEYKNAITFDGEEYFFIPHEAEGFEVKNDGSTSRPTIKIINIAGFLSNYMSDKNDLVGAKITRTRTFLKFLDPVNFYQYDTNPGFWKDKGVNPDSTSKLMDEEWVINRKMAENKFFVQYELVSPLELENVFVPRRQIINNYCFWKYRGKGCGYSGDPIADANDSKFQGALTARGEWVVGETYSVGDFTYIETKEGQGVRRVFYFCTKANGSTLENKPTIAAGFWATDQCSKSLKSCRMRFKGDEKEHLPFGGFPGSRLF